MKKSNLSDIQKSEDTRGIFLSKVGCSNMTVPIKLDTPYGIWDFMAIFNSYCGLKVNEKGISMSRFPETITKYCKNIIHQLHLEKLLNEISRAQQTNLSYIDCSVVYPIKKTAPVSRKTSWIYVDCKATCYKSVTDVVNKLQVKVPISTLCPCSLAISNTGAHNQRAFVTLEVSFKKGTYVEIEKLVKIIEKCGSGQMYNVLKREDEKYCTEKMFKAPRFVEDVVRECCIEIEKSRAISSCINNYLVDCLSLESIHSSDARAVVIRTKNIVSNKWESCSSIV